MDDLTDMPRADLERMLYRTLAERDAARRSARLCRELLTEALNRTRGCPRCNPEPEDSP